MLIIAIFGLCKCICPGRDGRQGQEKSSPREVWRQLYGVQLRVGHSVSRLAKSVLWIESTSWRPRRGDRFCEPGNGVLKRPVLSCSFAVSAVNILWINHCWYHRKLCVPSHCLFLGISLAHLAPVQSLCSGIKVGRQYCLSLRRALPHDDITI